MNKEMYDISAWAVNTAESAGADDCKVSINKRRFVEVGYRKRKPENIKEASTKNLSIQIYVNNRYSSQSTSDLRKEALKTFIINAIENTKLLEDDKFRFLPDPKYYEGREKINLDLVDLEYSEYTAEDRHELAKAVEDACLKEGGDKVISVTGGVYDHIYEEVVLTGNGFEGYIKDTVFWAGASMTGQDEGDRHPTAYNWVGCRKRKELPDAEDIGKVAAQRTLKLFGGKKINTETLPIIIENRNVPRVLSGFTSALYGANVQQERSFLKNKKGKKIGSDKFTLIDNPFIPAGLGSRLYDGDGFPTKKRQIIKNGVLNDFLIDWYYSRKLDCEPTSGGTTNLIMPPGNRSVKQIMKDLGRGIFITGFIGGNSNSTTGDFSVGIIGHLFDNGAPVQAIAEMNIADNHLKFWNKLIEIANDPWKYSSWQMPSLVFDDVVVAGI